MYTGFSSYVKREGIEYAAKIATEHGFSSVEFFDMAGNGDKPSTFHSVADALTAKQVLDRYGLSVACYSVGATLVTPDREMQKNDRVISDLKRYADMAAALGSPFLHHTLILDLVLSEDAPAFDDVLIPVVEAACEVANYCQGLGLTCLYEGQGMYFNGVDGFGRFYSEMKKRFPNVGVCGDVGNTLFVDESPVPFFQAFAEDIKHVHLKDYRMKNESSDGDSGTFHSRGGACFENALIGCGQLDIASCLNILKACSYRGAFALEIDYKKEYSQHVRQAFSVVRNCFG